MSQAAALAGLLGACAPAVEPATPELCELERLAFVPPAACVLPKHDLSLMAAIVFDRFEVTHADLACHWPERAGRPDPFGRGEEAGEHPDWPASLDFHEAQELARRRGMRLPTPTEWLHVAVGRRDYQVPWGGPGREFFANTVILDPLGEDFSLRSPCAVGTYENGKSRPFGCYDLLGNVWEWVDGLVLGYEPSSFGDDPEYAELGDAAGLMTSIMGGAYDTAWRPTYELDRAIERPRFHARRVEKGTLSPSVGARMCADAATYLWSMAPRWGTGPAARERVRAIARHWAENDALARSALRVLLTELRSRPGAPPALGWLEEGVQGGS